MSGNSVQLLLTLLVNAIEKRFRPQRATTRVAPMLRMNEVACQARP